MTRSQLFAGGILVAQAIVSYLIAQPDVILPPVAKVVLGAAAVGLSTIALFLRIQPAGPVIQVPGGGKPVVGE